MMLDKDHKAIKVNGEWKIMCKYTTGEFYTKLWTLHPLTHNYCLCCNARIEFPAALRRKR